MPEYSSAPQDRDRNFDDLTQRFRKTIYDSPRGALRLAALKQDFTDFSLPQKGMRVLDLGAGQGQFALWLAQQGAQLHLCDVSSQMLEQAKQSFAAAALPLQTRHCAVQDIDDHLPGQFDLVLNHAVLEWLADPMAALHTLCSKVAKDGTLSLMFYNLHGHRWRQLMIGRVHSPDSANQRLRAEGNSPGIPLDPLLVEQQLNQNGFEVLRWRGIRCIYDHMHQKIRERVGEADLTKSDLEFGLMEPYRQLGRYVHFLAKRRP